MEPRYIRNLSALTEAECNLLHGMRVAVIGCGGLGGHLIDQLARIGVGFIRVVDGDVFDPSNLNRQLLSEVPLLGTGKAQAAKDRISRVNPDIQVDAIHAFLTLENAAKILDGCHAVLDGLDNIESRKILSAACRKAGIPYIFGAIQGWVAQAAISMPEDNLLEILYPEGTVIRDKSVLSFTPALCASMQVSLCIKLLTGRPVETGTVYYFDLLNQEFEAIPLA
ncbi:MAG: HesA/MoeB/ThiF family protein [Oscillospiraceae bacterium]